MTNDQPRNTRYQRERRHRRLQEAKEDLGGRCVVCGTSDDLQFDHIDPTTKLFIISKSDGVSDKRFWEEVAKCQLLCVPHHQEKTSTEQIPEHGTWGMHKNHVCRCVPCVDFVNQWHAQHRQEQREATGKDRRSRKLQHDDVRAIRALSQEGHSGLQLSKQFGVAPSTISNIVKRKIWTDI